VLDLLEIDLGGG